MWMTSIPLERKLGFVRCSCVSAADWPLAGFLAVFGLRLEEQRMRRIDAELAASLLTNLLSRSFVGQRECISLPRARELATAFVADSGGSAATFYTNGQWEESRPMSFTPLTDAVFDGGVIAIGASIAACVWIEEDD